MISYPEALALLLAESAPAGVERVDMEIAQRRILARDVVAPLDLPSFDNAAMDGYAVHAGHERIAAGSVYRVAAMHAAGETTSAYPGAEACEIATGARMPSGFDTVVAVERTERTGDHVRFTAEEAPRQNVRYAGSDIAAGVIALEKGRRIDASAIMLLAALGMERADVVRKTRMAIITTGSELNACGPLPEGGIHDSNGPFLHGSASSWGADVVVRARVPDTGRAFHDAVIAAREAGADLIVTTGAVSAGRFDFVPEALASLGARALFHKVAIRPGKPLLAARFDKGPLVVALPGNPIAVAVGYRFFVAPVLRAMSGLAPEQPVRIRLDAPATARPGLMHFGLGALVTGDDGSRLARLIPSQAAYRIVPYAQADLWLTTRDAYGDAVDAWPLDPAEAR